MEKVTNKLLIALSMLLLLQLQGYGQTRVFGTYYGGNGSDETIDFVVTDAAGNVYMTGSTNGSTGIATPGAHQDTNATSYDAFLVKFNSSGVRQWATYYGGVGGGVGRSVAVDASGNIYLAGQTGATSDIATSGAHQTTNAGSNDGFLVKFNSSGVRQWGTYFGGSGNDDAKSVAVDASGNVYISGTTFGSTGLATSGAYQTSFGGGTSDGFLAKFNSSGVLQFATYYGGTDREECRFVSLDPSGNIYLTGETRSTSGIVSSGAHQTTNGGNLDGYIVKFNSSGVRQWASYYGGSADEQGWSLAFDVSGNVYMAGYTGSSSAIATSGAHQTTFGGITDAYLVKFNGSGVRQWGTYYGGTGYDVANSVATDKLGNVYITGLAQSSAAIATSGAYQTTHAGGPNDAYYASFNSSGVRQKATYFGGSANEVAYTIAVDTFINIYIAGTTTSTSGISFGSAHQTTKDVNFDGFLVKFSNIATISGATSLCVGASVSLSNTTAGGR